MKRFKTLSLLLLALMMLLASCQSTVTSDVVATEPQVTETAPQAQTTATITEVSRYGNIYLSVPSEVFLQGYSTGDIVSIKAGTGEMTAPVVTSYSDVDNGNPLVRVSGEYVEVALSYANFASNYSVDVGDTVEIAMVEPEGYLTEYQIRHLEKSEERVDYASDIIFANFRAMKGGDLKDNFLYRSCNPALDDARAIYADYLAEDAGIKLAINLADSEETIAETLDPGFYYADLYENGKVVLLAMGVDYRQADFAAKLKTGLEAIIANPEGPILIHCNEGKDRAGMVAALLEALAGASMDEIVEDYMTSYENYYGVEKGTEQYDAISSIITDFFTTINGRPFPADGVKTVAEVYLTSQVGLSADQLAQLEAIIIK